MENQDQKFKVLLGVSGSVATIKLKTIVELLSKDKNYEIRVIVTEKSKSFLFDESEL